MFQNCERNFNLKRKNKLLSQHSLILGLDHSKNVFQSRRQDMCYRYKFLLWRLEMENQIECSKNNVR